VSRIIVASLASLLFTACAAGSPPEPLIITPEIFGVTVNPQVTATPTPEPTPTPIPLAARVNGQPITLAQYQAELARYLAASPDALDAASERSQLLALQLRDVVLDALIEQALIEQEASRRNIAVSEQQITDELAIAKERAGGEARFQDWLSATRQTEADIRELIRRELLMNALRDQVVMEMPRTAEYVHAYHIVVATEREARQILTRLQNGAQFTSLAQSLSLDDGTRAAGGDLGWFARDTGAVIWPEVEDAAFSLQPGETSDVVKSPIGYHIIRVTEREVRPLSEADTTQLQVAGLSRWIADLKARAQIERFI